MHAGAGGFALATELADHLVENGLPFRQAHEVVGRLVAWCVENGRSLESLQDAELARFSPRFRPGARRGLDAGRAVERRKIAGGTARKNVQRRLAELDRLGLGGARRAPRPRRRSRN